MSRLGLDAREQEAVAADPSRLDGLDLRWLMTHLACADEDHPLNAKQLERFHAVTAAAPARWYSLANSAGICLGRDYAFDLVRPGLDDLVEPVGDGDVALEVAVGEEHRAGQDEQDQGGGRGDGAQDGSLRRRASMLRGVSHRQAS